MPLSCQYQTGSRIQIKVWSYKQRRGVTSTCIKYNIDNYSLKKGVIVSQSLSWLVLTLISLSFFETCSCSDVSCCCRGPCAAFTSSFFSSSCCSMISSLVFSAVLNWEIRTSFSASKALSAPYKDPETQTKYQKQYCIIPNRGAYPNRSTPLFL